MQDRTLVSRPSLVGWFRSVIVSSVVASDGDYFERLERSSALAAPLRTLHS